MNFEVLDKLRFILNREINVALAPEDAIQTAINRHYGQSETESVDSMLQEFTETAIDFTQTEITEAETMAEGDDDSAPIIRLVDLIISEAVTMRASDIHVEPFEDRVRVRYRIDGVLVERDSPPRRLLGAIVSRIKIRGPGWTLPKNGDHRMAGSRPVAAARTSTCGSASCQPTGARRS
ncbi:MAG: hypothetical protein CM1200mP2_27680 [Planctomycetaceae bacterium]|nr:MAG: hypothetical protein CM1200mP2_27680 [Planctomycetaceae bacterium]